MQAWQSAYDRGAHAYASGDLVAAESAARDALARARAGEGSNASYVASSLNLLALVRQREGKVDEAVGLLGQALDLSENTFGDHPNTAALALNLGNALDAGRRSEDALRAYGRALAIAERAEAAAVRQDALQALGRLHAERGELERAQAYDQRLLAAGDTLALPVRAAALERLARAWQQRGDLPAAHAALVQALALRERADPPDPEGVLSGIEALAQLLVRMDQGAQAALLHERAVTLLQVADPASMRLAHHLNELGLWTLQQGRTDAALEPLRLALRILQERAPAAIETARVAANLAQVHEARRDDAAALAQYRRALDLYQQHGEVPEALLGQAQALNFLAGYDFRRRRLAQAEPQFLRALELTEQAEGAGSVRLLPLLDNLAALYRSQQRPEQARLFSERAERLRTQADRAGS